MPERARSAEPESKMNMQDNEKVVEEFDPIEKATERMLGLPWANVVAESPDGDFDIFETKEAALLMGYIPVRQKRLTWRWIRR